MNNFDKYQSRGAYHWDWYETEEWYRKCVDKCVEFCKGSTVDVGCGDGLLLSKLPKRSLGLDNSDTALQICKDKELNVTGIDLDDPRTIVAVFGKYDYVACLNTIEHLNDVTTLLNLVKSAKKGAIIITDMPQEHPSKYHVKEYSPKELADLFSEWRVVPFQIDENFHGIEIYK